MSRVTELLINGVKHSVDVDAGASLLSVLRDDLDLTGSKYGCGEGQCGACTVLLAGAPRRSCITPVGDAARKPITTIEGLEKDGQLHPVQQAFLDENVMQCGYCTSGMIMTTVGLLTVRPEPTDEEIAHYLEGHICRCGTYPRIIAAVRRAAKSMREARS
ncbi:MAG: (2Fe-2S)-binding protein [Terriglobia bacterium]|jgi:aerobic-type carbon monoxide dehydrogenase small subunit (CoxS/CutS family)